MRKRVKEKKKSEQKKKSEKKIESGKSERKTKKNNEVFMLRQVMSRMLFIQTSLYLYSCTKKYALILTNLTNLCLVLLFLCCRNMRTRVLTMCLVDCHLLKEQSIKLILCQVRQFLTDQPIGVIRSRQRNFKSKLRSC